MNGQCRRSKQSRVGVCACEMQEKKATVRVTSWCVMIAVTVSVMACACRGAEPTVGTKNEPRRRGLDHLRYWHFISKRASSHCPLLPLASSTEASPTDSTGTIALFHLV